MAKELEMETEGIKDLTEKQLWEIAQQAAENAEELYGWAEYDGYVGDIKVTPKRGKDKITITASGEAVKYIEYGTDSGDYWFFSGKGRDIELNAGGAKAHYKRLVREKDESTGSIWWFHKGRAYLGEPILDHGNPQYEEVEKADSYITKGNPPQFIMQSAFEDIINRIGEFTND